MSTNIMTFEEKCILRLFQKRKGHLEEIAKIDKEIKFYQKRMGDKITVVRKEGGEEIATSQGQEV